MARGSVRIFISYSHKDDPWRQKLTDELELLDISVWTDRKIKPGDPWHDEIIDELAAADIILLLISRDFLASDFVKGEELPKALARLQDEEDAARIVPVLLRETSWKKKFDLAGIQAIPTDEKWLAGWSDEDAAIRSVARELEGVVEDLERAQNERTEKEEDYRRAVAEALADDDDISVYEERTLEEERKRLGLSEEVACRISETERRRIQVKLENIRAYEEDIEIAIKGGTTGEELKKRINTAIEGGRPFDDKTSEELKKRKAKLELRDDDVAGLEQRVAAQLRADLKAKEEAPKAEEAPKPEGAPKPEEAPKPELAEKAKQVADHVRSVRGGRAARVAAAANEWTLELVLAIPGVAEAIDGCSVIISRRSEISVTSSGVQLVLSDSAYPGDREDGAELMNAKARIRSLLAPYDIGVA